MSIGSLSARLAKAILRTAALFVPRHIRNEWMEEWAAEVWHYEQQVSRTGTTMGRRVMLVARCLGAFPHALWIRGEEWTMDMLLQDFRYAVRTLMRKPGFTLVATLTLAIGIGGNTAIFSIINTVLLQPLDLPESDRIVRVLARINNGVPSGPLSAPDFRDYREAETRMDLAAYSASSGIITGGDRPEEVSELLATANLLSVLGLEPVIGRTFTPEEEIPGAEAAMISYELWQTRFAGDPGALGTGLTLDGQPKVIVGVLPPDMAFPNQADLWLPLPVGDPNWSLRAAHFLPAVARLDSGATVADAQAALDLVSARLEELFPDTNEGWYAQAQPLQETLVGNSRPALFMLMSAVGLVLLIATGNVASLLMARASGRTGEMALRSAMGASQRRIVRQLMTESLTLALAGGAAGLAISYAGLAAVRKLQTQNIPRLDQVVVDGTALLFTLVISVVIGIAFGLIPSLKLSGSGVARGLREGGRGRSGSGQKVRNVLVSLEVALSTVLLIGASLLIRTLNEIQAVDTGIDPEGLVTVPINLTQARFPVPQEVSLAMDQILEGIVAIPGVGGAAAINTLPFSGSGSDTYVHAEGFPIEPLLAPSRTAQIRFVTLNYFETVDMTISQGRNFDGTDASFEGEGDPATVINQALARRLWPNQPAVGERLWLPLDSLMLNVVGVVEDVTQFGQRFGPAAGFYILSRAAPRREMNLVIAGAAEPGVMAGVRSAVWNVDPEQAMSRVNTLEAMIDQTVASNRFQTLLLGVFAAMALLLASIGIYGILAFYVGQRRREIGIRMAVGADQSSTVMMIVRKGTKLTAIGLVIGLLGAAGLTRLMTGLLFQVNPLDPKAFMLAPAVLATVAFLASYLPAVRAARIDPATALRQE